MVRVVPEEGDEVRVAAHGGFVQVEHAVPLDAAVAGDDVTGTRITLLLGVAELADEIDADRARTALEAAEARLAELTGAGARTAADTEETDPELAEAEADVRRGQVRLEAVDASTASTTA